MKIYTKTGDKGETSLLSGHRVTKTHTRLTAYGTVDELNSQLGLIISLMSEKNIDIPDLKDLLIQCQHNLFNVGSLLACDDESFLDKLPQVDQNLVTKMEEQMDQFTRDLPALKNFILPGGSVLSAQAHIARCICRRAERKACEVEDVSAVIISFLNRLSDYLFVVARQFNKLQGNEDVLWSQNKH